MSRDAFLEPGVLWPFSLVPCQATGNEETHALVRCHPGDSQREGSLPSQVATCPPAAGVVKAMLISVALLHMDLPQSFPTAAGLISAK